MDNFSSRHLENEVFDIIREPVGGAEEAGGTEDGSEFLNESGPGMEEEKRDEAEKSIECNDDSLICAPSRSGEVY